MFCVQEFKVSIEFTLNCRMVKGSPSEALVVISDGSGCCISGVGVELKELHSQFLI